MLDPNHEFSYCLNELSRGGIISNAIGHGLFERFYEHVECLSGKNDHVRFPEILRLDESAHNERPIIFAKIIVSTFNRRGCCAKLQTEVRSYDLSIKQPVKIGVALFSKEGNGILKR
jgi:hypothetical protein